MTKILRAGRGNLGNPVKGGGASVYRPTVTLGALSGGPPATSIAISTSEPGTVYWNLTPAANPIPTPASVVAASGTAPGNQVVSAGSGTINFNFSAVTAGDYRFNFVLVGSVSGKTSRVASTDITITSTLGVVQQAAMVSGGATALAFTLPSGITAGNRLMGLLTLGNSNISAAASGWSIVGSKFTMAPNGEAALYRQTSLSAGTEGGTTVTFTASTSLGQATFHFWEMSVVEDTINAFDATVSVVDGPSHTPAGGSKQRLWFSAAARTNGTSLFTAGPTGYGNLLTAQTGFNSVNHVNSGSAYKLATLASDDPDAFTGGAGTSRAAFTWSVS